MASRKKNTSKKVENVPVEEIKEEITVPETESTPVQEQKEEQKSAKTEKKPASKQKFGIGALVFVVKDVEADLNGFCLFSQYKKDPYTVEAYDALKGVYTLRRQKLLIKLKERDIMAPDENAHDSLNRMQY